MGDQGLFGLAEHSQEPVEMQGLEKKVHCRTSEAGTQVPNG
jgi:hypothetical protein